MQRQISHLTFTDPLATNVLNSGINDLKDILKEKETNYELQQEILEALNSMQSKHDLVHNIQNNYELGKCLSLDGIMHTQQTAGCKKKILGRWSPKWKEAQRLHYL